jgi:hypothetical protein
MQRRYSLTADEYLLILRSLPINKSVCCLISLLNPLVFSLEIYLYLLKYFCNKSIFNFILINLLL